MKKHINAALLLMGLAMFSMPAHAQVMSGNSGVQPYVGTGLGFFGLEFKDTTGKFKHTAFGGYANMGVNINQYFALDLRLGRTASASQKSSTTTTTLSVPLFVSYFAKGRIPLTSDLEVYGLLGGTTAKLKGTNTIGFNQQPTKTGLSYGLGMDYRVQDSLSVGAEWVQYWTNVKLNQTWGTNSKAKLWGAVGTIAYHF